MELGATTALITNLSLKKSLAKYEPSIKHIAVLMVQKNFEAAVISGNNLIQSIALDITNIKNKRSSKLRDLLNDCLETNKKNYQACFNSTFQILAQQPQGHQLLNTYFNEKLMQAKTDVSKKRYISAICICGALKHWLTEALRIKEEYQFLWKALLTQCGSIYESVYFYWLQWDEIHFTNYHYIDTKLREEVLGHMHDIKKHLSIQDYQGCFIICTNFIQKLNSLSSQATQASSVLAPAWHKAVVFQRQQTAFAWLLRDYLTVSKQVNTVKMLYQDLSLLTQVNYFSALMQQELQCKLGLMKLLFSPSIEQETLNQLRDQFCSAFDAFYTQNENNNTALSLLGLALMNAYEGDKQAMLTGFKLATDNDANLKKLTHAFVQQLPFHLYPVTEVLLPNPFNQWATNAAPHTLRPKP